jgi:hypothetical protein
VAAPDDGDGTDPVVGGDLADCVLGEAPLPVKTVSTSVMANNGGFFVLLRCCSSSPLDCFEETYLGLLDWTMGARRCLPPGTIVLEQVVVGGDLRWSGVVSSASKTTSLRGMAQ